jgi:hypothetical protein
VDRGGRQPGTLEQRLELVAGEPVAGATGLAGGAAPAGSNATVTNEERERTQRVWWYLLFAGMLLLAAETVMSNKLGKVRV